MGRLFFMFEYHQIEDSDYLDLKITVEKYLSFGSCDGRVERGELREKLAKLINKEYNKHEHKLL